MLFPPTNARVLQEQERGVRLPTRARELAAGLGSVDGVRVHPDPPHTNAFRVFVDATVEALEEATLRDMETDHVALASWWRPAEVPGWAMTELTVGDATLDWDLEDQLAAMRTLVSVARRGARAGSA